MKKIIGILGVLLLVLGISACGSKKGNNNININLNKTKTMNLGQLKYEISEDYKLDEEYSNDTYHVYGTREYPCLIKLRESVEYDIDDSYYSGTYINENVNINGFDWKHIEYKESIGKNANSIQGDYIINHNGKSYDFNYSYPDSYDACNKLVGIISNSLSF